MGMSCDWSVGVCRGFLTSCEAELQELMKQIDIMVAHKKSEWEGQTHALETCLDIRDRELKALRSQLDMKHKEVERLLHFSCYLDSGFKSYMVPYTHVHACI